MSLRADFAGSGVAQASLIWPADSIALVMMYVMERLSDPKEMFQGLLFLCNQSTWSPWETINPDP